MLSRDKSQMLNYPKEDLNVKTQPNHQWNGNNLWHTISKTLVDRKTCKVLPRDNFRMLKYLKEDLNLLAQPNLQLNGNKVWLSMSKTLVDSSNPPHYIKAR